MTVLFYIFLAVAFLKGGYSASLAVLALALYLLVPELNIYQYILFSTILISIPLSAFIAGLLLDRFIFNNNIEKHGLFNGLLFCASMFLALNSNQLVNYIDAALSVTLNATRITALVLSSINTSLLAGCILALSVIFILLMCELPFKLLKVARDSYANINFSAIRPILACFILALTLQITSDYMADVLFPDKIQEVVK